jgi:hypothetical protein
MKQSFRVVVLNSVARRVVEAQRGRRPKFVFMYKGERTNHLCDSPGNGPE